MLVGGAVFLKPVPHIHCPLHGLAHPVQDYPFHLYETPAWAAVRIFGQKNFSDVHAPIVAWCGQGRPFPAGRGILSFYSFVVKSCSKSIYLSAGGIRKEKAYLPLTLVKAISPSFKIFIPIRKSNS